MNISAANALPLILYVQNINYDLSDNYVPTINTVVHHKNAVTQPATLNSKALINRLYLSTNDAIGPLYIPSFSDTVTNIQTKLSTGKTVRQTFSYTNMDGNTVVLGDVSVYM